MTKIFCERKKNKNTHRYMTSNQDRSNNNLKLLMEAEEQAKQRVDKAKAEKVQKLAQSREDAKQRVLEMKREKDEEFMRFLQSHNTDLDSQTQTLNEETDKKVKVIEEDYEKHKDEAVDVLAQIVLNVK